MRALLKELDDLRRDKERDSRRAREDEDELRLLRDQCERLEDERRTRAPTVSTTISFSLSVCHHH
jgi:protein SPA2